MSPTLQNGRAHLHAVHVVPAHLVHPCLKHLLGVQVDVVAQARQLQLVGIPVQRQVATSCAALAGAATAHACHAHSGRMGEVEDEGASQLVGHVIKNTVVSQCREEGVGELPVMWGTSGVVWRVSKE